MATISELTFVERVLLPFCTVVPLAVGALGYWVWKRDKAFPGERMSERMSHWFVANCAGMLGLSLYHVLRHVTVLTDYRWGMGAFGASFLTFVSLALHLDVLKLDADSELLMDDDNEVTDFVEVGPDALEQLGTEQERVGRNVPRRRYIAFLTYAVLVFQSGFDGLVLKYNPNAQDSAVQVAMFFLAKGVESVVVSTALIHAGIKTRFYVLYMCNFTITVGLSTLSAYDLVGNALVITIFESWIFQLSLGATGGLLLCLSFYFLHIEAVRRSVGARWAANLVFISMFSGAAMTGMFG
jgi:hypothetical protein